MSEFYLCEYSKTQGCFHIETLSQALQANRRIVAARASVDYVPFALCDSYEEASRCVDAMMKMQERCGGSHHDDAAAAFERGIDEEHIEHCRAETERLERAYEVEDFCGAVT